MSGNLMAVMHVPDGELDFCYPSEIVGYIVMVFGAKDEPYTPVAALPYGFFTGDTAADDAQAFGERHVEPYGNHWTIVPVQSTARYQESL